MEDRPSMVEIGGKGDDQSGGDITPPVKKKRNLPGMPDPDAEVIVLSPKTLLATNRFVCEICNKGFQRDQNLQLHRRGHNLPWKLRQRTGKEIRKRVYVCPEPSCVHHDPSRALGDLTGIKKHFSRKHGEKKFSCERCSKKYAVQSDWKAHMKTCGTREYRCDCGTLFSRRDSFITHRAFCDALAEESARSQPVPPPHPPAAKNELKVQEVVAAAASSPPPPPLTPSTGVLSPVLSIQSSDLPDNQKIGKPELQPKLAPPSLPTPSMTVTVTNASVATPPVATISPGRVFPTVFSPPSDNPNPHSSPPPSSSFSSLLCPAVGEVPAAAIDPMTLTLSSSLYGPASSLFPAATSQNPPLRYLSGPQSAALSATALLQKAAQMSATSSNSPFLRSLGLAAPSSPYQQHDNSTMAMKLEASGGLNGLMMSQPGLFGSKPATVDFLGLGMGDHGESGSGSFSAFLNSIGGGLNIPANSFPGGGETSWDDSSDRKPSML